MAIDLNKFFELEIVGEKQIHIGTEGKRKHFLCKEGNQTFLLTVFEDGPTDRKYSREQIQNEYNRIISLNQDSEHKDKINQWYKSINK